MNLVACHNHLRVLEHLRKEIAEGRITGFACVGLNEFSSPSVWSCFADDERMQMVGAMGAMHSNFAVKKMSNENAGHDL